jgi:hypothetical protein
LRSRLRDGKILNTDKCYTNAMSASGEIIQQMAVDPLKKAGQAGKEIVYDMTLGSVFGIMRWSRDSMLGLLKNTGMLAVSLAKNIPLPGLGK